MSNRPPEEEKIIAELCEKDEEFKRMWEDHVEMKRKLKELKEIKHPTDQEKLEMKKIKKVKLQGKDRIQERIRVHSLTRSG